MFSCIVQRMCIGECPLSVVIISPPHVLKAAIAVIGQSRVRCRYYNFLLLCLSSVGQYTCLHTIQFHECDASEVCCCFAIKTMTHKAVGSDPALMDKKCVTDWIDKSVLFFFCLLSVVILSFCFLNVVWDTIHECHCLCRSVSPTFIQHSTSNTHFTILEWWHCLCLLLWLWC